MEFRNLIIDHFANPQNRGFVNDQKAIKKTYKSKYCVDDLTLEMLVEGNTIKSARFDGLACTIATSVIDLFCIEIEGKTISQVQMLVSQFNKMITEQTPPSKSLGKLALYNLIAKQPKRARCALIAPKLIHKIINSI